MLGLRGHKVKRVTLEQLDLKATRATKVILSRAFSLSLSPTRLQATMARAMIGRLPTRIPKAGLVT